jgi:PAS domain S-box-containing protein
MKDLRSKTINKKYSETARQNEKMLSVAAQSAQMMVETSDWKEKINDVLKLLGEASQASHAYLFENHLDENGIEVSSLRYEWENPHHNISSHVSDFQNVPLKHEDMMRWYKILSSGKPFYDSTNEFPEEWANKESRKEIKTLLDVPIFVDGVWWGVIGLDDCTRIKPWSQVEVNAIQIAAGLLGAVIKRQKSDEAIKASEEKFQTTFHESLVPMVIGRVSDRLILDVNPAFSTLTGFSREESVNHFPTELGIWANQAEREQHREILSKQGYLREFKAHLRKKSGDIAVVLLSVSSVKVNLEECLLYTIYEITQLEKALTELQDKNNELERFTYTVSHDLKAPLITIGGFAGLLAKDVQSGNVEKANRSIERILDAVTKMERLLNELLQLSRVGRMINEPQVVSFEEIAKEAVGLTQGRLRANKIPVEIEANLPRVKVDRPRIIEVMQNLLDNASKFMGEQKNPKIKIGARQENEMWVFFVSDNGIGIDPAYHERVFGLFNKLDSNSEGTGVGLALVKRIIEFHGCKVWVESEGMNKGATFCFTLPVL